MASMFLVARCSFSSAFAWHFQSCGFPKSVHAFVIDHFASSTKQHGDSAIAKPRSLSNQLKNLLGQPNIFVLGLPYKSLARSRLIEYVTGATLRDRELLLERPHRVTSRLRACQFPLLISLSIWMSNAWSPTIFLSRLFSSSSILSRLASSLFMPPY